MDIKIIDVASRYGLHDTVLTNIIYDKSEIVLIWDRGVFIYDNASLLVEKIPSFKLRVSIPHLDPNRMYEHTEIYRLYKNRRMELEWSNFTELLKHSGFRIYREYYSFWTKAIKLEGQVGKYQVEMLLTDVDSIQVVE